MTTGVVAAPSSVAELLLDLGAIADRVTCAGCGATEAALGQGDWKALLLPDGRAVLLLCPACLTALPRLLREHARPGLSPAPSEPAGPA